MKLGDTTFSKARVFDCRTDNACKSWSCQGEVEKVTWNHFRPYSFLSATDSGKKFQHRFHFVICQIFSNLIDIYKICKIVKIVELHNTTSQAVSK